MASLQIPITSGFAPAQAVEAHFRRVRTGQQSPAFRMDVDVTFVVLADDGATVIDTFEHGAQDVGKNFDWFTPAFRSEAWTAYLAKTGATEV